MSSYCHINLNFVLKVTCLQRFPFKYAQCHCLEAFLLPGKTQLLAAASGKEDNILISSETGQKIGCWSASRAVGAIECSKCWGNIKNKISFQPRIPLHKKEKNVITEEALTCMSCSSQAIHGRDCSNGKQP